MSFNEEIANRIREELSTVKGLAEKPMFRGMCFMVSDMMCICVNEEEIMCRIGPGSYAAALKKPGCRPMMHSGKAMEGFVFVSIGNLKNKEDLFYWIDLALAYNKKMGPLK